PAAPKRERRPLARRRRGRRSALPDLPRRVAPRVHVVQALLVLERVHGYPEPVVAVGEELVLSHEPLERVHHEVSTVSQIVEDLGLEDEVAAVDTEARLPDVLDAGHLAAVARRDEVVAQLRRHAQEARDVVVAPEMLELRG